MAKLENVSTIDMQDGIITKVSYQGDEYTKVDGLAQAGDLMRPNGMHSESNIKHFEYYTVIEDEGSSARVIDEVGDVNGLASSRFDMFRKSPAAVSPPFAEMITSKIDAVEERVSALEASGGVDTRFVYTTKPIVFTPTFNEGDRVKALRDGEFGDVLAGDVGRVTPTCADASVDPYHIRVDTGDDSDYFRPQDLELATVEAKPVVGDIVVITGNTNGSRNKAGDAGRVFGVVKSHGARVNVPQNEAESGNFTYYSEMRHATPTEVERYHESVKQAKSDAIFTKAGRKPNEYRKGDVVRYLGNSSRKSSLAEVVERSGESRVRIVINPSDFAPISTEQFGSVEIVCFAEDRKDNSKGGR